MHFSRQKEVFSSKVRCHCIILRNKAHYFVLNR